MPPNIKTSINARIAAVSLDDETADANVALSRGTALANQPDAPALTALRALAGSRRRQASPALDGLGTNLIERIADEFPSGSKDVSRLCAVSQTFCIDLADRAFTDKLCARAGQPLSQDNVCDVFEQLITQSVRLPQRWQADVLKAVLVHLPKHLHSPLAGLDHLLHDLLEATKALRDPLLQRELQLRMGANFETDSFRLQCFNTGNVVELKPAMADFYKAFKAASDDALFANASAKNSPAGAIETLPASELSEIQKRSLRVYKTLVHGLFMIPDNETRHAEWNRMRQDPRCGSGDERVDLLRGLSDELVILVDPHQRSNAFALLLGDVERLSAKAQPDMIWRLAQRLNVLTADSSFTTLLGRLSSIANALPADEACVSMCHIIRALPRFQPVYRREIAFGSLLNVIRLRPAADQARMLPTLASRIFSLSEGESRVHGYDTLWSELPSLDLRLQTQTVRRLVAEFDGLPEEPEVRQIRFVDAINFVRSIPPENRFALLGSLIQQIHSLLEPDLQMSAFHTILDLATAQPLSEQAELLHALHERFNFENFDVAVDDTTHFAMASAIGWAAARLPPKNHAALLVNLADAALWWQHPFMARHFKSIVEAAQRLPAELSGATLANVSEILERRVSQMLVLPRGDIPACLFDLLETADRLPNAMRIRLLQRIVPACRAFTESEMLAAHAEIQRHLHGLPIQSLAELQFGPEAR